MHAEKHVMDCFRMCDEDVREAFDDIMDIHSCSRNWLGDHQKQAILMARQLRDAEADEWATQHDVATQAHVQPENDMEEDRQRDRDLMSDPDLFY